ncbi:AraC family transcriptional regulator [Caulobacter mirabilis]|uniref:HTH araC/xylS-type domain-containing protein n=1 Tax=Caulobacter mirabilis TaxID=69666 RepID=A0A2D2ASM5_9CAUL|nr:AraC family transcriptional regulator [Caulobacter mirabilis]ATQ41012.1 hypothetical protein CSW64_00625 [Caulobacter mirabilis]
MEAADVKDGPSPGGWIAERFRVPRRYLDILAGSQAAADLIATVEPAASGGEMLPSVVFLNLCLEHMRRTSDEAFAMAPRPVARGTFGLLIAAASQGDTFGEALQRFAMAAPLLRPDMRFDLVRSRRGLALSFDYPGPRRARHDLASEIFALTAHCGFRWLTGKRLKPVRLRVPPAAPPVGPTLLRPILSRTAVRRGEGVTVTYDAADADLPLQPVKYQHWAAAELSEFNTLMEEAAEGLAAGPAAPDIVNQVRAVLGPASWDEPSAARRLGMSTATLRRRLAEVGTTFRNLASDARRRAAASLLVTERSLEDVAQELGFSDARSLRRACRAWFGATPAEYRRTAG